MIFYAISLQLVHAQGYIPPEGVWRVIVDGVDGSLDIKITNMHNLGTANPAGKNIAGTIKLGSEPTQNITGFYNDNVHRIVFIRIVNPTNVAQDEIFTGYIFPGTLNNLTSLNHLCSESHGFENTHTLTGYFEGLSVVQALSPNNVRGWYGEYSYCEFP
jgi:hypothetical protein